MNAVNILHYCSKTVTLLVNVLVIRPAVVLFGCALFLMVATKAGPAQVAEITLQEVAGLVALGPAPAGYLNIQRCADTAAKPMTLNEPPPLPEPMICENHVVEAVPIADMAAQLGGIFEWGYLVAVILGVAFRFLFNPPDWPVLRRKEKLAA